MSKSNGKKQRIDWPVSNFAQEYDKGRAAFVELFLKKYPLQFRRQYVIGNYIADFYCHKAGLVVELDGSGHYEQETIQKDLTRTQYLESQGLLVLRFTNLEVTGQFQGVCEAIDTQAKKRFPRGEAVSVAD